MKQFANNARVCFVGDSITHLGIYIKHIVSYYRECFSELNIEFYNCGIAGGNLSNAIGVFEEDIAIYEPTHIVLMIGVNDSFRNCLNEATSENRYANLLEAYENYKTNMLRFYQLTKKRGIELILCTPMPYAEYQESDEPTLRGGYSLIQGYAEFVRCFAKEQGLDLCDYHKEATRYMQKEVIYEPDRVHPTSRGHALMAKIFFATLDIDYEIVEDFSEEIKTWYNETQILRNIITTEFLTVSDYLNLSDDERFAKVMEKYRNLKNNPCNTSGQFIDNLIESYITEKPQQSKHIDFVKNFMKNK